MPEITLNLDDETMERLAVLAEPGWGVSEVVGLLVDHAQQGVYRPGAWERGWLCQAFGYDWIAKVEPDDDPRHLSSDGGIIFDRPRHA